MTTFQVVLAEHPRQLAKLVRERLFQYIEEHPEGVIALPTGHTPELLIQSLNNAPSIPNTDKLRFVQLDEYFPIPPKDPESFCFYVRRHYLSVLRIAPERALTMEPLFLALKPLDDLPDTFDLSLLERDPLTPQERLQKEILERVSQFCTSYEQTIRDWGGIGFFLGGIGLDGHIAFNQRGSDWRSKTRLVQVGTRLAVTIGIETICQKRGVQAVLFAAGEEKAPIVARAIQGPCCVDVPATALRSLQTPEFYLTKAAAKSLYPNTQHHQARPFDQTLGKVLFISFDATDRLLLDPLSSWCKKSHHIAIEQFQEGVQMFTPDVIVLPFSCEESWPSPRYRALQIAANALKSYPDTKVLEIFPRKYPFGSEESTYCVELQGDPCKLYIRESTLHSLLLKADILKTGMES